MKKLYFLFSLLTFFCVKGFAQCSANITYTNEGYTYFFQDNSQGEDSTTTYNWSFGNGDTSSYPYPSETFQHSGTYIVCLTINTVDISCISQKCDTIIVAPLPCQVSFTYTNNGYEYQFSGHATGADSTTTYLWDFGNEDQAIVINPIETFGLPGQYLVCFSMTTASDSCSNHGE